ncbi:hypothetical protein J3998_03705 [Thiomicrorhabdus sp. 6S2-11]|uniref:Uncharacterized protein n=1 Tax=Thiomicrorhabdus marina TaxID=2818442 RepID=A0ABS3Q3F8_9GAMM|nr:hypothetical protein [Thiomicrorhabdus marina]MBO1926673.1 hypothetical protein [Thiomicrorhabdus marina]
MQPTQQQYAMQADNLALWDSVSKTDPDFTKFSKQRGGFTSIDPMYQLKTATKVFGLYGSTWGLKDIEHDYSLVESLGLVTLKAVFWYPWGAFEIGNAIHIRQQTRNGEFVDADALKKLETNTLSKALSKPGFNADVYLGMFEDVHYTEHRAQEAKAEKAIDHEAEKLKQAQAFESEMADLLERVTAAPSMGELKGLYTMAVRKANLKKANQWLIKLERAKDKRKAEIEAVTDESKPNQETTDSKAVHGELMSNQGNVTTAAH